MKSILFIKNSGIFFFALTLLLLLGSCDKEDRCIRGNGHPEIETRSTGPFNEVVCNGAFEVHILPASYHEVQVDAESNLIDYIRTSVVGNRLYIETENNRCISNSMTMIVTVYTPYVDAIEMNGSGSLDADDLYLDDLFLRLNGSGELILNNIDVLNLEAQISGSGIINLSGIAETTTMNISGSGNINAFPLSQLRCFATITGSGNMYVRVASLLDAVISGSGSIYYRGNPDIVQRISGSGRVIKQ